MTSSFNSVIPDVNPADIKSQSGRTAFLFDKLLSKIEKIAPAQVLTYDRQTNRATVQILNQNIASNGDKLTKKPLKDIPVLMLYGGGFVLSFPIKTGDIGWICAADRDISIFKKTLKVFAPATYQKHRYEDSFFIPNLINDFVFASDDTDAVLLTSLDGTTRISVKDKNVTVTSENVTVNATTINATASNTNITSETVINGNLTVNGTVTTSSSITASGEITGKGIELSTHVHGGVEAGSGTTSGPQ